MMLSAVSLYHVSLGEEKSPDRVDDNQAGSSNVELVGRCLMNIIHRYFINMIK